MLTFEILRGFRSEITEESKRVVNFLRTHNRAIYEPEFDSIWIQPYPPNQAGIVAVIQLYVIERLAFGNVTLNFAYTVDRNGHVWPMGNDRLAHTYMHGIHMGVEYARSVVGRPAQARAFTASIREELVAAVWHPDRVAKHLEAGGWDLVEAL